MTSDRYALAASMYDLALEGYVDQQDTAVDHFLAVSDLGAGYVLDIGCGSGRVLARVLARCPQVQAIGLEPSGAMRSLALGRLSAESSWRQRVTVRPEGALEAPLPERLGGVVMLGVLGHFTRAERHRLLERLSTRLGPGGAIVLDLQMPERPEVVPAYVFADATVGQLRYRGIAQGDPLGELDDEAMSWRMTYQTLEGDRLLEEGTAEHVFHHPPHQRVGAELAQHGLTMTRIGHSSYWLAAPSA